MIYTVFMAFASVYGIIFSRQIAEDKRSRTAYCFITGLMLFLIAGLRSTAVGGDSGQYARLYALVSRLDLSDILERFNSEPLFYVFAKFLSIFSTSYTFLFCVIGAIFAFSISYFIYRFSEAPYISLVMLIPMQFFPFTLSGCRQALTLSIVLLAISLVLKKSYIKFAIVLLVAYFIHNSTIFVLPFILLVHLRNKIVSRILFVAGMIFTSCQSNSDNEISTEETLIGSWSMAPNEYGDIIEYVFSSTGEFTENVYIEGKKEDVFKGTYSVQKNTLTISIATHQELPYPAKEYISVITVSFRIDGDKLYLQSLTTDESAILTKNYY